jgi:hypothetical protein
MSRKPQHSRTVFIQGVDLHLSLPLSIRIADSPTPGRPYQCVTPAGTYDLPTDRETARQVLALLVPSIDLAQKALIVSLLTSNAWYSHPVVAQTA